MNHKGKTKYKPTYNEIFRQGIATKVIDIDSSVVTVTITSEAKINCFVDSKVSNIRGFEELISYCTCCQKSAQWEHTRYMLLRHQSLCRYAMKENAFFKSFKKIDGGSVLTVNFSTDKEANHFVDHLSQAIRV